MKHRSAAGPDGWTVPELRTLPEEAWTSFLTILGNDDPGCSLTMLYRRVPVEKGDKTSPEPDDLRPIDIYSVLWRLLAPVQVDSLIGWRARILHPTQFASKGGVLTAASRVGFVTESILYGRLKKFAVSVDFAKLFNTLDAGVCAKIAMVMGLSEKSAKQMIFSLLHAKEHGGCLSEVFLPCLLSRGELHKGCLRLFCLQRSFWGLSYGDSPRP